MVDLTQAHKASIELLGTRHTALVEAVRNYVNGSVQPSSDELIAAIEDVTTDIDTKEKMLLGLASRQATRPVPSLILDFKTRHYLQGTRRPEKGYGIHDLLTIERATPKWVYRASGKLTEVPANEPAYQHDPVTGEPQGILIEESRTNYVSLDTYGTQRHEILEMVESPLPGHPARRVIATASGSNVYSFAGSVQLTTGQTCVHSIYAKATETNSIVQVGWYGGANRAIPNRISARFNLTSGTILNTVADAIDSGIEPAGDGWYHCWISAKATQDGEAGCCVWPFNGGVGDETIWGLPQVEKDATRPSSYIPVTNAPVTRAADNVYRELGNEFNPGEGTLRITAKVPKGGTAALLGDRRVASDSDEFSTYDFNYIAHSGDNVLQLGEGILSKVEYFPAKQGETSEEYLIRTLFGNGEFGGMYVYRPVVLGQQALYQDKEGTVPVTADGDPVGYMADLSGNDNHNKQSMSTRRMTLHGSKYLRPDGIDDIIIYPIGSEFVGDFALILSTGVIFGSFDNGTFINWGYTTNGKYNPEGDIHAVIILDRAITADEKQQIASHFSEGIISRPSTAKDAFRGSIGISELDLSYVDWSQVTDASHAFHGCKISTPPDVSSLSNVTNTSYAFSGCTNLTTPPDVSSWTQVTNASHAFQNCSGLTTPPDVTSWTKVTDVSYVFSGCSGLTTTPDVTSWTQVTNASYAFTSCSGLTTPPDVSGWTQVTNAYGTFAVCSGLTSAVDLTNWNPTILTNAQLMMTGISAAGFDQATYDAALIAWDTNYDLSTVNAISIVFGSAKYTAGGAAEAARTKLVNAGWVITDGGAA